MVYFVSLLYVFLSRDGAPRPKYNYCPRDAMGFGAKKQCTCEPSGGLLGPGERGRSQRDHTGQPHITATQVAHTGCPICSEAACIKGEAIPHRSTTHNSHTGRPHRLPHMHATYQVKHVQLNMPKLNTTRSHHTTILYIQHTSIQPRVIAVNRMRSSHRNIHIIMR